MLNNSFANYSNIQPKLLICSEDIELAGLYSLHLHQFPFQFVVHTSYSELLLMAKSENPDLIIACITEPLSHFSFLKKLKNMLPHTSLITSGFIPDPLALSRLMDIGVVGHLDRSVSHPRDIIPLVTRLIFK